MRVLYASCRKNFDDPYVVGDGNLYRDENGSPMTEAQFVRVCTGKRVCILVHGYRSEADSIWTKALQFLHIKKKPQQKAEIYGKVLDGIRKWGIAEHYDIVLGYLWPGDTLRVGFTPSEWRADKSAKHLTSLVCLLNDVMCEVDVQTHSLGARVALEAVSRSGDPAVRNLFLLAPAVADECVEMDEKYGEHVFDSTTATTVFYSKRDKVLQFAFTASETLTGHPDMALGFHGAENPKKLPGNVSQIDCTEFIGDHSAYSGSQEFHDRWRRCLAK